MTLLGAKEEFDRMLHGSFGLFAAKQERQINLEISLLKETSVHPHIVDYLGHVKTSDM